MCTFESSTVVSVNLLNYVVTQMTCDLCAIYLYRIHDVEVSMKYYCYLFLIAWLIFISAMDYAYVSFS